MSSRGRKPVPSKVKQLRGNPGKRPLPTNEPQPEATPEGPKMPHGFKTRHKEAAKFWDEYAEMLGRLQVATEADGAAFRLMANHYGFAVLAARLVEEDGLNQKDERGLVRKHPLLQVFRDNSTAFLKYAEQFGMTPSARARLGTDPDGGQQRSLADALKEVADDFVVDAFFEPVNEQLEENEDEQIAD